MLFHCENKFFWLFLSVIDNLYNTVHKLILDFQEPTTSQKYYYKVGREGFWSEERSFTLRNRNEVISNGYNYLQITDQQGFNAEEYES